MLGAAFFFSLMSLLVKIAGQRLPVAEIVFARSTVMLVISFWLVRQLVYAGTAANRHGENRSIGAPTSMWGHRKSLLVLRGLVGFGALFCFFFAVTRLPLADITVIHFTNPVFTAVLASIFLGESMGRREASGLVLCLVGVALVAQPSFLFGAGAKSLDLFAVAVALCASVLSSIAYTLVRKLRETDHHLVVVFYFTLVSAPASVPLLIGQWVWPSPVEWLVLLGVGVVTQIAQICLTKGLHRERAGRAMSISYVQVLFAATWGAVIFGDFPNLMGIGGALLVFGGTLLVARHA
ncbi:MAG: DMT family transporter [Candidatus Latescibacterota bacterium]|nr:MAG: DMT family transporter [Candidatus Latescibacterota bacterium]